jgi:hypothetical protein
MTAPGVELTELEYQPNTYVPAPVRIAATYAVPKVGESTSPVDGHPDNVEIELNVDTTDLDQLTSLVERTIASLFRCGQMKQLDVSYPGDGTEDAR